MAPGNQGMWGAGLPSCLSDPKAVPDEVYVALEFLGRGVGGSSPQVVIGFCSNLVIIHLCSFLYYFLMTWPCLPPPYHSLPASTSL